jgi:hypothetical protein
MPVQDQRLNFEDLLQTVQESERGRWFLSEFESRLRKAETAQIFAAINKLEAVMADQGKAGADSILVARARTAIAAARREIATMEGSAPGLSDEVRLFAKLADMARTAFSGDGASTPVNAGITRALRLVDQIEQDLSPPAKADGGNAYFPADAGIFEQPQQPAPVAAIPSFKPVAKDVERGAKLLIRKSGEVEAFAAAPVTVAPAPESTPSVQPPETSATVASITPAAPKAPRVVIIRRKPEELLDVPLVDETASSTAA